MKIAFFEIKGWESDYLKKELKDHSAEFFETPLTAEYSGPSDVEIVSIFVYSKIDKDVLDKLPNLKLVTTRSTGFDHIDIEECKKRNIAVSNVPFYGENTVAEHTFGLILSLSRNIHTAYVRTLRQDYSIEGLKGFDLKGKTIGIIGGGHIGLHVVRAAKSFGMNALVYDTSHNDFMAEVLEFTYVPLEELLSKSDVITLHVPENKFTHHLINKESIGLIKKGAILINTSRGGIIDTDALIEALDKKILAGVGLDVLEGEELIKEEKQLLADPKKAEAFGQIAKDHVLLSKDNVVFTPHIAFYSQEALERILDTTTQNIVDFLEGKLDNMIK